MFLLQKIELEIISVFGFPLVELELRLRYKLLFYELTLTLPTPMGDRRQVMNVPMYELPFFQLMVCFGFVGLKSTLALNQKWLNDNPLRF